MKGLLIILIIAVGAYGIYHISQLLQGDTAQISSLQQQLVQQQQSLAAAQAAAQQQQNALNNANGKTQTLQTFGGSISALFGNIF